ncbi:ufm1-specific protease 2-like [Mya arenaria]|uniref:ufm1-specific protease 2-like n=1 Tax=Mya arenaria TaxID=6604 RepID=UPI0022E31D6A|nr:ufm1-specific protease 2-like [Mya arenaria]
MATCVKVSRKLVENSLTDDGLPQYVFGTRGNDCICLLGCSNKISDPVTSLEAIERLLPGGIDVLGFAVDSLVCPDNGKILHALGDKDKLVVNKKKGSKSVEYVSLISGTGETSDIKWTCEQIDVFSYVTVRTRCQIPVSFTLPENGKWQPSLHMEVEKTSTELFSDSTMYHLATSPVLLGNTGCYGLPNSSNVTVQTLVDMVTEEEGGRTKSKKERKQSTLLLDVYMDQCNSCSLQNVPSCSPVINYKTGSKKVVNLVLGLDAVSIFSPNTPVEEMTETLGQALRRQVTAMEHCIVQHSQKNTFITAVPYHCQPVLSDSLFTVVYPNGVIDEKLESYRREIHQCLSLPEDRPMFRRANHCSFPGEQPNSGGYMVNVHEHVPKSKVTGGHVWCVQGQYTYHHYMQDRFDDNKWGCAYRSLQTLVSWFRHQGYTDVDIPSHKTIQQTLVDIGDKEPNFVGSRKWIGSMEVSFVLDTLIGVTSKILSVSTGSELAAKGRELAAHFQTQGTPIMIGGGVLAHTILGVDYDEVTGDISFLILDPHYTGAEDLKTIVDKGWCGWKGPDFWDQNAHYNMCMPQRPVCI